ncbi:hypothetical protein KP509_13G025600 [Ceratopteris richardii]|nr:hypothetical protein KP509_13G025600 [Ceratopteris richardii]
MRDEARRVLVRAFQGEDNLSKKWEEEIKRRELAASDGGDGGDGGSRGSGLGGGGGGGDGMDQDSGGQNEPWDWEEAGQTFMATFVLFVLYFSITHGPDQVFDIFKVFFIYIWQGFRLRVIPEEYLRGDANPREDEEREGELLEEGDSGKDLQRSGQWETNESYEDHVPEREESMEDTDLTSFSDYSEKDREEHIALLEAQSRERVMKMIPHRKMEGMEELDES